MRILAFAKIPVKIKRQNAQIKTHKRQIHTRKYPKPFTALYLNEHLANPFFLRKNVRKPSTRPHYSMLHIVCQYLIQNCNI